MSITKLSEELTWRGFVNQTTYKDIAVLDGDPITFYWGVDPSAKSMHVGQLAMSIMIKHFINAGHIPILLVGGATGLIGDPDGKDKERELKTIEEVASNKSGIAQQYEQLFNGYNVQRVDNYDWFKEIGYLDFLRDVGKHVPMRQMLGREFVQSRLSEDGAGISYAEFSYSLIQGYDFLHLHRTYGATLQVCGADQWGNSIAGVELIRRIEGAEAHIWSAPLIINKATGKKFGKSEEGTVWLDPELTSPYQFYQFWLNVDDEGVEDYLKIYTLKSQDEIAQIMHQFNQNRGARYAQKMLAYEVTSLVHGHERADSVQRISEVLFGKQGYDTLTQHDYESLIVEIGSTTYEKDGDLLQLLVDARLASSKSEARRFIDSGAIYLNGAPLDAQAKALGADVFHEGYAVLRRGKNTQTVIASK